MNGVDLSNQLRKNLTAHRPYERRIWRPLWYYTLDVCAVNSYLIWKGNKMDPNKRGQRRYRETLIDMLLNTPYPSSPPPPPPPLRPYSTHYWERFDTRGYCIWCKTHSEEWKPKRRPILNEIVNQAAPSQAGRQSRTHGGCTLCSAYLCVKGACFQLFHKNRDNK
jgi:hypothetical protein